MPRSHQGIPRSAIAAIIIRVLYSQGGFGQTWDSNSLQLEPRIDLDGNQAIDIDIPEDPDHNYTDNDEPTADAGCGCGLIPAPYQSGCN